MKRSLLIIPLILLLLIVNACIPADPPTSQITNEILTAVENTKIAATWTITPTPTINPNIATMVTWLNVDLLTTDSLGLTMDAQYSVNNITFLNIPNSSNLIFQVDVGCTCMNDTHCCTAERTFVDIIDSMKNHFANSALVPETVSQILVVCFDQKTKLQIGAMLAPWRDVRGYLQQQVSGNQLGVQVTRTLAP